MLNLFKHLINVKWIHSMKKSLMITLNAGKILNKTKSISLNIMFLKSTYQSTHPIFIPCIFESFFIYHVF